MKAETPPISQLYYRYKKVSDEDLRKYLKRIKIVKQERKGVNSVYGYYPLTTVSLTKLIKGLRRKSLTFDVTETANKPLTNLKEYKTITYLVKSSSRFFLKPDIGEIFDQIDYYDLLGDKIKAICFNEGYQTLDGTDGEHFLMTATLLTVDALKK